MRPAKDWGQVCPDPDCHQHTAPEPGMIISIATYQTRSGKRRIFYCKDCKRTFSETRDTVFFDLRTPEERVMLCLRLLVAGVEVSQIAQALEVTEESVLRWLRRAAQKAEQINEHLLKDVRVTQVQLDEMWNFIARKHSEEASSDKESPPESTDGRQWVWISYAPEFRLMLAVLVGPRSAQSALRLIQMTAAIVLGVPCFFSDGFSCYLPALIACYHTLKVFPRTGKPGRPKDPVKEAHPDLVYAQVIKDKQKGRLKSLTERVVCGSERLSALGYRISTSLIERLNLTLRRALAPLARKSLAFCKQQEQMHRRVVFYQAYYNWARPHQSLREPLAEPVAAKGAIQRKWVPRTPGMAAGLTDHVWTFRELLTAKRLPVHYQSTSQ
jgi:transposase-like protein/IS1 family transposase